MRVCICHNTLSWRKLMGVNTQVTTSVAMEWFRNFKAQLLCHSLTRTSLHMDWNNGLGILQHVPTPICPSKALVILSPGGVCRWRAHLDGAPRHKPEPGIAELVRLYPFSVFGFFYYFLMYLFLYRPLSILWKLERRMRLCAPPSCACQAKV